MKEKELKFDELDAPGIPKKMDETREEVSTSPQIETPGNNSSAGTEASHSVVSENPADSSADQQRTAEVQKVVASQEAQQIQKVPKVIELTDRMTPIIKTMSELGTVVASWMNGKALPVWINTKEKAFAAAQFALELGMPPLTGIQHMCEINGRIQLWGEGPLAVVRNSGKLESIDEFQIDKDYKKICMDNKNLTSPVFAAMLHIKRVGAPMKEFFFTSEEADKAKHGIEAVWKENRRIMMKRKNRAVAIKDEFGDVLFGMGIAEYDHNFAPDLGGDQATVTVSAAERLEQQYGKGSQSPQVIEAEAVPNTTV